MRSHAVAASTLFAVAAAAFTLSSGVTQAAAYTSAGTSAATAAAAAESDVHTVQYRHGYHGGPRAYYGPPRGYYAPRAYGPRAHGGPVWGYRPWYRRPYYGTIIGGVALGTIIAATAYGFAPRPPRPDLCWYWADEFQSRGYWDYC